MLTADYLTFDKQHTCIPIHSTVQISSVENPTFFDLKRAIHIKDSFSDIMVNPTIGTIEITTNKDNYLEYNKNRISTKDDSVIDRIEQQIFDKLYFPKHWEEENIDQPNQSAKMKSLEICKYLFKEYNLIPSRIAPTKEVGIFLSYENPAQTSDRTLIIEIYNNLEVAALINDNSSKKILYSADITDFGFSDAYKYLVS